MARFNSSDCKLGLRRCGFSGGIVDLLALLVWLFLVVAVVLVVLQQREGTMVSQFASEAKRES